MFNKVLVGVDASTRGRDAIALARVLAGQDAEITLGHVLPPVAWATGDLRDSPVDNAAADVLLRAVAAESGIPAGARTAISVSISDGLRLIADEIDADVLVIGGTKRNRITRALLGNLTSDTLSTAGCTVALAPVGYADTPHEIRRVGVAYDGSEPSETALSIAQSYAESMHAELVAFKVVPTHHDSPLHGRHQFEKSILAMSAGRRQIESHPGVQAQVGNGDPVEQLGGFSRSVDVLVAGARGAGLLARLLHPSTTEALADVVTCPLVVITKEAREKYHDEALSSPARA